MNIIKKGKIFYGWFIVLAGIIITAAGIGIFNSTNSVFVKPICDELNLSRGEFTLHRTIITLIGAFLMPLYGKIIKRYGIKKIFLTSSVSLALVTVGYSFTTQLWHFYAIAAINGVFINGVNFMVVGIMVGQWFDDKKGFATGLAYCGSGLGAAIMVPIVGQMIEQFGWRWSYRGMSIIAVLILIPTVLFIVKEHPESMGLKPYTDKNKSTADTLEKQGAFAGIAFKQALRTPTFWMLAVSFLLISICAGGPNTHTIPYLTDIGYSPAFAASILSLTMIVLTAGKILLGFIFDRFGTLSGSLFVAVCCLGYPLLAMAALNPAAPWAYAVLLGLASCGFSVPVMVLITKYFGNKDIPILFSVCTMITTFGTSASVPMMGAIYDITGSYKWAWTLLFIFAVIITICLIGANITNRRIIAKYQTNESEG